MPEVLEVHFRTSRGKRNARRMRQSETLPAVLYGHGEETLSLTIPADDFRSAVRHGSKLVTLVGDLDESALIRDTQWDALGVEVLHVDFMRVRAGERLAIEVAVHLRGEAPGIREGGVVEQLLHRVEIETPATEIPERLHVNVNELKLAQLITVKEIEDVPQSAKLLTDESRVIVQCVRPVEEELDEGPSESLEPELITRQTTEEDVES